MGFLQGWMGLTTKEECFLYWYAKKGKTMKEAAIMAGFSNKAAAREASKIVKKPEAKKYIDRALRTVEKRLQWGFEDKLKKLKKVADLAIPDSASTMDELAPTAGIQAIAESNKMQGHYSAEKVVNTNINVDTDLQQVEELLEKYTREY
jgi:phage terminase small subunit